MKQLCLKALTQLNPSLLIDSSDGNSVLSSSLSLHSVSWTDFSDPDHHANYVMKSNL